MSVCLFVGVALLLVIGQLLHTLGWSSRRVHDLCGRDSGPFVLDQCHIGLLTILLPLSLYCVSAADNGVTAFRQLVAN